MYHYKVNRESGNEVEIPCVYSLYGPNPYTYVEEPVDLIARREWSLHYIATVHNTSLR